MEDDGPAFDPFSAAEPDTEADVETRDVGGLGVHFVRRMAREAAYERRDGLNRVTALLDAG
jgi:serine/threonine-protein kinase RsbW